MTGMLAAGTYGATSAPPPPPGGSVQLSDQDLTRSTTGTATVSYNIASDGKVKDRNGTILESWMLSGVVADYEVMATLISGSSVFGLTATWLSCSTTRAWSLSNSAHNDSTLTSTLTVDIRNAVSHTVLATALVTLNAESLSSGGGG